MGFIYALRSEQGKNEAYIVWGYSLFVYPLWGHCYFLLTIPSMPAPQTVKSSK